MKRFILILLSALLVLPLFAACGGEEKAPEQTTEAGEGTTAVTESAETELHDDVPELDYNGATISFFVREGLKLPEYYVDEMNGEVVNDAIYERNNEVSERLNVEFAFTGMLGDYSTRQSFAQAVTQSVMAGAEAYDIVSGYSMAGANLAFSKVVRNLYDNKYIDLEKPWWPDSLISETTVNGFLPFVSGDISSQMLYALVTVVFNKQLLEDHKIDEPYDLVRDGKWTLDAMFDLTKGAYVDLNGNGEADQEDSFGLICLHVWYDAYYWGCGLVTVEKDSNNKLILSPGFSGEKTVDLVTKLGECFGNRDENMFVGSVGEEWSYTIFKESRSLFIQNSVSNTINRYRDVEFEYGILPVPKWDEEQENYITNMSFTYSLYCIPVDISDENAERNGAVLECLASASYKLLSPAIFETAMKVKYASDPDSAEMYDLVRAGATFDIGRVFNDSFGGLTYSLFRGTAASDGTEWVSKFETNRPKMEKVLEELNEVYAGTQK